jgi:hypothetical protein
MRRAVAIWASVVLLSCALSAQVTAQSLCNSVSPDRLMTCVSELANIQCRGSASLEAHKACFSSTASKLLGKRISEIHFDPDCESYGPGGNLVECLVDFNSGRGAPEEWCQRINVNSIQWCEGDPPVHKCRQPVNCPVYGTSSSACAVCYSPR